MSIEGEKMRLSPHNGKVQTRPQFQDAGHRTEPLK